LRPANARCSRVSHEMADFIMTDQLAALHCPTADVEGLPAPPCTTSKDGRDTIHLAESAVTSWCRRRRPSPLIVASVRSTLPNSRGASEWH
jgi:hypothetical protein